MDPLRLELQMGVSCHVDAKVSLGPGRTTSVLNDTGTSQPYLQIFWKCVDKSTDNMAITNASAQERGTHSQETNPALPTQL